jgi:hypothetical protein
MWRRCCALILLFWRILSAQDEVEQETTSKEEN